MLSKKDDEKQDELTAPLAGQVIAIKVQPGDFVKAGQEIVIVTAMKMENIILSERDGRVNKIFVKEYDNVSSGQILLEFE
jgi:propionyl-CoA carboxylase alpha chain